MISKSNYTSWAEWWNSLLFDIENYNYLSYYNYDDEATTTTIWIISDETKLSERMKKR
jgi:hypothetical protein